MKHTEFDPETYDASGIRPLLIEETRAHIRVGAIPTQIAVDRAKWVIGRLREKQLPYRFSLVAVPGFDRHSILNRDSYYASSEQVELAFGALQKNLIDLLVLPLSELPRELPEDIRLAALTTSLVPAYAWVYPKNREVPPGARIGVSSFSLSRQLRRQKPNFHYEQRVYNFDQARLRLQEGIWQAVVLPYADLEYSEAREEYSWELLPVHLVVPPAGQGALALLVPKEADELASVLYNNLHSRRTEKKYKLEVELSTFMQRGKEAPGCCLWESEQQRYLSLYNPHLQRPFQRWATQGIGPVLSEIDKNQCYALLQKVIGRLTLMGMGNGRDKDLTVEGKEQLQQTDCLIARSSQAEQLYHLLPGHCEIHDLEKERTLFETEVLLGKIREVLAKGLQTTLLLRGDGYLFSRGSTLGRLLAENHIPFHYIPGLNIPLTAAARAGVPLMSPGVSPSFHFFDGRDPLLSTQDFSALRGTLVFATHPRQLSLLIGHLLSTNQFQGITPALYIVKPGTGDQCCHWAMLEEFTHSSWVQQLHETDRGLLLIGESLHAYRQLARAVAASQPLAGKTILLPLLNEAGTQEMAWKRSWEEEGAEVLPLRLFQIQLTEEAQYELQNLLEHLVRGTLRLPVQMRAELFTSGEKNKSVWKNGKKAEGLWQGKTWLCFMSPESVRFFFDEFKRQGFDSRQLFPCGIVAVNQESFQALAQEGIQADFQAPSQSAEGLALDMKRFLKPNDQVLVFRNRSAGSLLETILQNEHIPCRALAVYEQKPLDLNAEQLQRLFRRVSHIVFSTPYLVEAFAQVMVRAGLDHCALRGEDAPNILAVQGAVRQALEERGFQNIGDLGQLGVLTHF